MNIKSNRMMVKGFSKKHFEYMIESKLAVELDFDILDNGLDILITEPRPSDKIGPLEFFLIQDPIIIIITNFGTIPEKPLNDASITMIGQCRLCWIVGSFLAKERIECILW